MSFFFFSSRRRHTRWTGDWSSDVCSSDLQGGHRHRASGSLTSAGGKGINVARALKRLDTPVVATGLAGGRTGDRRSEERRVGKRGEPGGGRSLREKMISRYASV